jgi:hypothetical protein
MVTRRAVTTTVGVLTAAPRLGGAVAAADVVTAVMAILYHASN